MTSIPKKRVAGGRPPKFKEVRRPVTVTLPERILQALERIDGDRARALVKCVEAVVGRGEATGKMIDLVEVLPGKSLIVVPPSRLLGRIEWLRLVEMAPGRYLLVLPPGMPTESLEVELHDLLDAMGPEEAEERLLIEQLQTLMVQQRRRKAVSKGELVLVHTGKGV